jgi:glycosyltransferase involved in cell wall biosynthesis
MAQQAKWAPEFNPRTSAQTENVVIVEPLARSTGHQSWFAGNLAKALVSAGAQPALITFDGMLESADLALRDDGCDVRRVLPLTPGWLRWLFGKVTRIKSGMMAARSVARSLFRMYLYNQLATASSVLYACRMVPPRQPAVVHLLCPPSWLTVCCVLAAARARTRFIITTFRAPGRYRANSALLRRLCRNGIVTIVVQTEALASEWIRELGADAVRMIALPCGDPVCRADQRESRRLLDLPLDKPIVAVIGSITPEKGYIELFQALRGMPKDFRVLLAGDTGPWTSPDPKQIAQEAGWLDHTIIRREFLPERLMPALFGAVSAVALLYREPDGSSGILSLCQQYGVPVIATRFGELGAKVRSEDLGLTADPNDPEDVAGALKQILLYSRNRDGSTSGSPKHNSGGVVETVAAPSWADCAVSHLSLYAALRKTHADNREDALAGSD